VARKRERSLLPYTYILANEARSVTPPQKDFLSSENINRITFAAGSRYKKTPSLKNFPFRPTKFLKIFDGLTNQAMCQGDIVAACGLAPQ
jgi:hypothetical protein